MKKITDKSNTDLASNEYPFGKIRDKTALVPGTPVNSDVYTDVHQFFQKLFEASNMQPNGTIDNGSNGFQIIEALGQMISRVSNPMVVEKFVSSGVLADFDYDWQDITNGGGYFYRAGNNTGFTEGSIAVSRDGIQHEILFTTAAGEYLTSIAASDDGKIMAVGSTSIFEGVMYFSIDYGQTWVSRSIIPFSLSDNITYAGGDSWGFTIEGGGKFAFTDDNGLTFNTYTLDQGTGAFSVKDIAYGDGKFCIVGSKSLNNTQRILFTVDGSTITSGTHISIANPLVSVVYAKINQDYFGYISPDSDKGFLAITDNSSDANTQVIFGDSTGLVNFPLSNKDYKSVAYGNGKIVMISEGEASDANIEQTFDLFRNTQVTSNSLTGSINDMVYAGGKFVMCGDRETTPLMQ
tara:strand:- start:14786 stop:16006 length:1221 start_codon:yes stop_codon:yes gene_type:complete